MRAIGQIVSILAIALGIGLLVTGQHLSPPSPGPIEFGQAIRSWESWQAQTSRDRETGAAFLGFGAGFLTIGILGLIVPWANLLIQGRQPSASQVVPKEETQIRQ